MFFDFMFGTVDGREFLGCGEYSAPEIQYDSPVCDERSNIYSLGAILAFLIGRFPAILSHTFANALCLDSFYLARVIFTMLDRNPDIRYQTFEDVEEVLRNCSSS